MNQSLCETCEFMRAVWSACESRFVFCRLSQTRTGFPKYPPQPVIRCEGHHTPAGVASNHEEKDNHGSH
jgi:hypothetical protein